MTTETNKNRITRKRRSLPIGDPRCRCAGKLMRSISGRFSRFRRTQVSKARRCRRWDVNQRDHWGVKISATRLRKNKRFLKFGSRPERIPYVRFTEGMIAGMLATVDKAMKGSCFGVLCKLRAGRFWSDACRARALSTNTAAIPNG